MTYPTGPSPEMPPQNPTWPSNAMPGASTPYQQMPNAPLPYPPMASVAPPPPTASNPRTQRNLRIIGLIAGVLVILLIAFTTLPSAVAGSARAAYPTVHAVITGASDGQTIPVGQSLQLSAANSTGNGLTYSWDFGDGTTSDQATVTHVFNQGGQTTISLFVKDALANSVVGHSASTSIGINVQFPAPTASFTYSIQGPDGFGNTIVNFDASRSTGNSIQSYNWSYGDGNIDYGVNTQHYFTSGQSYTVTLTVTDANNQTGQTSQTINT